MRQVSFPSVPKSRGIFFVLCLLMTLQVGCRTLPSSSTEEAQTAGALQITSPAFDEGGRIPVAYTCDGKDISPQLDWAGIPEDAISLALITDDPDAPVGTWVHWVLYDLPPDLTGLPEAAEGMGTPGKNSFQKLSYGGPCPPKGSEHRYYFKLYALDVSLSLKEGASKAEVEKSMQGHILAQAQLMGRYGR